MTVVQVLWQLFQVLLLGSIIVYFANIWIGKIRKLLKSKIKKGGTDEKQDISK